MNITKEQLIVRSTRSKRIGAAIIDSIFVSILSGIAFIVLSIFMEFSMMENMYYYDDMSGEPVYDNAYLYITAGASVLAYFFVYYLVPMMNKGRSTVGKAIMKLKVVNTDFSQATFGQIIKRNWFQGATIICTLISVFALGSAMNDMTSSLVLNTDMGVKLLLSMIVSNVPTVVQIVVLVSVSRTRDFQAISDRSANTLVVLKEYDPEEEIATKATLNDDWIDAKNFTVAKEEDEDDPWAIKSKDNMSKEDILNSDKSDDDKDPWAL